MYLYSKSYKTKVSGVQFLKHNVYVRDICHCTAAVGIPTTEGPYAALYFCTFANICKHLERVILIKQ